ncbi:MAG TPA: hypothetical protein PK887_06065 [Ignavibacteriales bacterium]|nr:hypothetical protein [Ignavibacteriales bacterium]
MNILLNIKLNPNYSIGRKNLSTAHKSINYGEKDLRKIEIIKYEFVDNALTFSCVMGK